MNHGIFGPSLRSVLWCCCFWGSICCANALLHESQRLPKTLFCPAVQVRQETFWLWIKVKSYKSQCWNGWLTFRSLPSTLWDWRGCSESHGAQKPSHVRSAISVGLKSLWCKAGVFSLNHLLAVLPHQVGFLLLLKLEKKKGLAQQTNCLFPNGRVSTLHPIFHTFMHLSVSQFITQCFKKVPGCVEACWPLRRAWGAFKVTRLQDPLG